MIYNKEFSIYVKVPLKNTEEGGSISTSEVVSRLLKLLKEKKSAEVYGYFLAVTKMIAIGSMQRCLSNLYIPVTCCCRTFIPQRGDVIIGTVYKVCSLGVFMKCGPLELVFLQQLKMGGYSYVEGEGEKPFFLSNDQSRIELNSAIRCEVLATRWEEVPGRTTIKDFKVLVTIRKPSLGPIQSAGSDAEEFETICDD